MLDSPERGAFSVDQLESLKSRIDVLEAGNERRGMLIVAAISSLEKKSNLEADLRPVDHFIEKNRVDGVLV